MATNLIEVVKTYFTPDVVDKAAYFLGESIPDTHKAVAAAVPTTVAALTNMASTSGGAEQIARMLDSGKYDGSALGNLGSLFGGGVLTQEAIGTGKGLIESLFGDKLGSVVDLMTRSVGIRSSSVLSLMALVAPVVMHVVGRQRALAGGGLSTLTTLLGDQRSFLGPMLPAGLASLLGWSGLTGGLSNVASAATGAATRGASEVAGLTSRWPSWLIPIAAIAALLVVALGYLWSSSPVREAARDATRRLAELQLPGGLKISVPEGTFNWSLATWLASTRDAAVPKRFIFDNLNFESNSTTLTPESRPTVDSLVAILKAYPAVSVALEGHTDSTGDAAANKKLSLDRAGAVKDILASGGIDSSRIATDGFGMDKPVASNDTEDGRAMNRRPELVVLKR
jgi:outer membrane protein OmpA-like peptidoglycan-associated protein